VINAGGTNNIAANPANPTRDLRKMDGMISPLCETCALAVTESTVARYAGYQP
jgi:hypothetical protein